MTTEGELAEIVDQWCLEDCSQLITALGIVTSTLPRLDEKPKIGKAPAKIHCTAQNSMPLGEAKITGQKLKLYITRKGKFFLYINVKNIHPIPSQRAWFWIKEHLAVVPAYFEIGNDAYQSLTDALGITEEDSNIEYTWLSDIPAIYNQDNQSEAYPMPCTLDKMPP